MSIQKLARAALALIAIVLGLAFGSVSLAGDLTIRGGGATSDTTYCMGTLHITSDTVADTHYGNITIRGASSGAGCDVTCGDGIVDGWEECDPMGAIPGCTSNCTWLRFPEYGGTSPYLDGWDDILECRDKPAPVPDSPSGRDVTFLAFGDPQYGNNDPGPGPGVAKERRDMNKRNILAMNRAGELRWPSGFVGAGEKLVDVRGVVIAGDLAQEGDACTSDYHTPGANCGWITDPLRVDWYAGRSPLHDFEEYAQFTASDGYGLCGEKLLDHPVFEGAGNHDYWRDVDWGEGNHPVLKYIDYRSNYRKGVDAIDPGGRGMYSWTWDDVHFVQLGLVAKDKRIDYSTAKMDPFMALSFLERDLELNATTSQPIVLIMHYPFIGASDADPRYSVEDRKNLFQVIKHHNVVALIHGHTHSSHIRKWDPCKDVGLVGPACATALGVNLAPNPIPVIDSGNPFYANGSNKAKKSVSQFKRYGHFSAIRITDDWLEASSVSWHGNQSLCEHANQVDCLSDSECKWVLGECRQNGEICLPGVKTVYCYPGQPKGPNDCIFSDPELEEVAASGWSVRVNLSNLAMTETHEPLYEYCPPMPPACPTGDDDGDEVCNADDNCLILPNPDQTDSNSDGYGNLCDPDLDNDGAIGILDFNLFRLAFGTACGVGGYDPDVDFDGDCAIGLLDFNTFRSFFGGTPGPSGLSCAGTIPCP